MAFTDETVTTDETGGDPMTIAEVRVMAAGRGVPGPDVDEHDEAYDGECYCRLCLSYL